MKRILFTILLILSSSLLLQAEEIGAVSPDGSIQININVDSQITYSVFKGGELILEPSPLSLTINGQVLGKDPRLKSQTGEIISKFLYPVIRQKSRQIENSYTLLTLTFKQNFNVIFRIYNDGVAYRFEYAKKGEAVVAREEVNYQLAGNPMVYFPEESSFFTHQEREYKYVPLKEITSDRMCSIPALVEYPDGPYVLITEADLTDYPGLSLTGRGDGTAGFRGVFPHYALADTMTRDRDVPVTRTADYLAKTEGKRTFPWRVMIITDEAAGLVESQMIYKLAQPLQLKDTDWIKPGKVAWDWWNANNIYGVDFRAGINNDTYKYYIDFALSAGLEYIILDEGWYKLGDLLDVVPEIDVQELVQYGKERGVGVILWVIWKTLDDQLEPAMKQFSEWGVKGIKVDFMQREDQWMVQYYHKIAKIAAEHHLLVDFHGSYKPTGLRRMYPNVMTREGVRGLEHCKWSTNANPEHNLTIPFIRMVAGPMDYTPGAMLNSSKKNFNPVFTEPRSMGTRCHQLAMYVVYESPLQMLADTPSNYEREPECLEFLSAVPTVWDETRVLQAKVADYILIARRSGSTWYIGGMTDWTARSLELDFSFLGSGNFTASVWQDGINADRRAADYKMYQEDVTALEKWNIELAPGGGWAAIVKKM